jgi:hypothetical protein
MEARTRSATKPATRAAEDVGRLVDELAHALRRPVDPADFATLLPERYPSSMADTGALPQILRRRDGDTDLPRLKTWRVDPRSRSAGRLSEWLLARIPRTITAMGAVAVLAVVSVGTISSFASLSEQPQAQLGALLTDVLPAAAVPAPVSVVQESKRMIERGNVVAARKLLEQAVATGNVSAIMALAETYDPNMLAAWGVRGQIADPKTARDLYAKANLIGIPMARQRLEALGK